MPDLHVPPLPFDSARAARILEDLSARGVSQQSDRQQLLEGVFGNSPFLGRLALREAQALTTRMSIGRPGGTS